MIETVLQEVWDLMVSADDWERRSGWKTVQISGPSSRTVCKIGFCRSIDLVDRQWPVRRGVVSLFHVD